MSERPQDLACVRALAAENVRLQGEVLRLRERAYGVETPAAAAFAEWFGLNPTAARILAALHGAGGEPLDLHALTEAGRGSRPAATQALAAIREALDPGALEARDRTAFRLAPRGRAECAAAIAALVGRALP
jgi:hypothetical protein